MNKFNLDGYGIGLWTVIKEKKHYCIWLLQRTENYESFFWWDIDLLKLTRLDFENGKEVICL